VLKNGVEKHTIRFSQQVCRWTCREAEWLQPFTDSDLAYHLAEFRVALMLTKSCPTPQLGQNQFLKKTEVF